MSFLVGGGPELAFLFSLKTRQMLWFSSVAVEVEVEVGFLSFFLSSLQIKRWINQIESQPLFSSDSPASYKSLLTNKCRKNKFNGSKTIGEEMLLLCL